MIRQEQFSPAEAAFDVWRVLKPFFQGAFIANGGVDAATARELLEKGGADLVSFGREFIANPDRGAVQERMAPRRQRSDHVLHTG